MKEKTFEITFRGHEDTIDVITNDKLRKELRILIDLIGMDSVDVREVND